MFEIFAEGEGKLEIHKESLAGLPGVGLRPDERFSIAGRFGKAVFDLFQGDGFQIWFSNYWMIFDTVLIGMSGQSVIELQIALINQIRGTWAGLKDPSLPARRFNFSFTRDILTRAIFQGGKHYSTFDIHFDKWFLVELAKDFPQLNDFLEEVDLQNASRLSKHNFTCPPEMLDAVQFILKNKYSRVAQKHMLENKVKEILIAALETSANDNTGTKEIKLTAADKEKLEHAKTLIELQPVQSPLSLQQLCRKVGLNEYKLKKGFKQLHGFSPYDYHVRRKIEEAKRLLVDTNDTITGIAYAVGYNHVQNFDIEFKKRVGCPPNHFRKYGNTRN